MRERLFTTCPIRREPVWAPVRRIALLIPLMALTAGCGDVLNVRDTAPKMLDQGIVYILPGIQGADYHYEQIRQGLRKSGIDCAIKIHPWGNQVPGINLMVNQVNVRGNRECGRRIAREIRAYQGKYPGRPIHMIGHSGGGAICVFTAESLAATGAAPIDGLVLLDASLSTDYDLEPALRACRKGIVNFYNLRDIAALKFGTRFFGNLDGGKAESAGRVGFAQEYPGLRQVRLTSDMTCPLRPAHFAGACAAFSSRYMGPWIKEGTMPEDAGKER